MALNRTAPTLPMLPTTPQRATHDYQRNGTVDLFAALDIATETVITDLRKTHTADDFIAFLNKVNRNVPDEQLADKPKPPWRPTPGPRLPAGQPSTFAVSGFERESSGGRGGVWVHDIGDN